MKIIPLADCATWFSGGTPKTSVPEYWDGSIPWITSGSLTEFRLRDSDRKLTEAGVANGSRLLPAGAVLFVVRGMSLNKEFRVGIAQREMAFGQDCKGLIARADILPEYLAYSIQGRSREVLGMVDQAAHGTGRLPTDLIGSLPILLLDTETQSAIVETLSAFDDLIENNRRRIEILEEMARLLYREWFVHFRFPGHEEVDLVDSELGPIPKGWEVARLSEFAAYINRGIAPKYDDSSDSIVVNQRCIRNQRLSFENSRRQVKKVPEGKLVRLGDVLINSTGVGTLGRVAPVRGPVANTTVDSHVTIVRPPSGADIDYFSSLILSKESLFESMGAGSTGQTELSRARIGELRVSVPGLPLMSAYGKLVAPMRQLHNNLIRQNAVLREARDLLLPRLVSGELDVSELHLDGVLS